MTAVNEKSTSRSRIILGATCFADASPAIRIAIDLAKQVDARIDALLIEEYAISHFSTLPYARTLSQADQQIRKVNPHAMKKAFERDATAFQETLALAADKATLDWSFDKKRGELAQTVLSHVVTGDFVIFGHQPLGKSGGQKVLILSHPNDKKGYLAELGNRVAKTAGQPTEIVVLSSDLDEKTKQEILEQINKMNLLAIIGSKRIVGRFGLENLLNMGRCPVLVEID